MEDFNVEQFVEQYLVALKANDTEGLLKLVASIGSDEDRANALSAIIAAMEADSELAADASKALESLKGVSGVVDAVKANVGADLKVEAPSIKMSDPVDTEFKTVGKGCPALD